MIINIGGNMISIEYQNLKLNKSYSYKKTILNHTLQNAAFSCIDS